MLEQADIIRVLIIKRMNNEELTPDEQKYLDDWIGQSDSNNAFYQKFINSETFPEFFSSYYRLGKSIESGQKLAGPARILPIKRSRRLAWIAASVLCISITGVSIWLNQRKQIIVAQTTAAFANDIPAGSEGAILTLADGSTVRLDSMDNGIVATQSGSQVTLKNGLLTYNPVAAVPGDISYNTIHTPKGRQFNVILPDGTQVWLDAASSIRYPVSFSGKHRRVEITGQAYFEVTANAHAPFVVQVNKQIDVEVLGTRFNINGYDDEAVIRTTLMEGAVRVFNSISEHNNRPDQAGSVLLKPGQQARVEQGDMKKLPVVVENADIEKDIAWRKGLFNFEDADLKELMRQISRWYDIEVIMEKDVPNIEFGGKMSRNISLSDLLKALKTYGVNFRMDEKRKLILLK